MQTLQPLPPGLRDGEQPFAPLISKTQVGTFQKWGGPEEEIQGPGGSALKAGGPHLPCTEETALQKHCPPTASHLAGLGPDPGHPLGPC